MIPYTPSDNYELPKVRRFGQNYYSDLVSSLTRYAIRQVSQGLVAHDQTEIEHFMFDTLKPLRLPVNVDEERAVRAAASWVYRTHDPGYFSLLQAARKAVTDPWEVAETPGSVVVQAKTLGVSYSTIQRMRRDWKKMQNDADLRTRWEKIREIRKRMAAKREKNKKLGKAYKRYQVRMSRWATERMFRIGLFRDRLGNIRIDWFRLPAGFVPSRGVSSAWSPSMNSLLA